jgi:hypothetical protein
LSEAEREPSSEAAAVSAAVASSGFLYAVAITNYQRTMTMPWAPALPAHVPPPL